jgi:mono/diheme cytochrome c family protein
LTLASTPPVLSLELGERTRYDRRVSSEVREPDPRDREQRRRRLLRLVVVPLILLVAFWATAFTLAKVHLAKPGTPKAAKGAVPLGYSYRGEVTFGQTCAPCHGAAGKGGGIGPRLQDLAISIAAVKAQIDNGGGAMPPKLVSGEAERDVLAYVATLIAPASG